MNQLYRIETEDRHGRFGEYELRASSVAEAEAIAAKPENIMNGSFVVNVIPIKQSQYDDGWKPQTRNYDAMWGVSGYYSDDNGIDIRDRD